MSGNGAGAPEMTCLSIFTAPQVETLHKYRVKLVRIRSKVIWGQSRDPEGLTLNMVAETRISRKNVRGYAVEVGQEAPQAMRHKYCIGIWEMPNGKEYAMFVDRHRFGDRYRFRYKRFTQ